MSVNSGAQDAVPLLGAALIVRDEAEALPDCLASLDGVVDEVHVHDTGSVDGTPAVAERYGATVTYGAWNGDFAEARNAAVAGWRTRWVLAIDADHRYTGDPAQLRAMLTDCPADVVRIDIDNAHDELPYTHGEARIYRPDTARWLGRVHEKLVAANGLQLRTVLAPPSAITLDHIGYAEPALRMAKAVRNAELARKALDELAATGSDSGLIASTLLDLGRSLVGSGRRQEAVDTFEALRELFPGTPQWLEATDFLARLTLASGMDDVCLVLVRQLRDAGASGTYCDWLAAQALAQLGDVVTAAGLLAEVTEVVDTAGRRYDRRTLDELRILMSELSSASHRG